MTHALAPWRRLRCDLFAGAKPPETRGPDDAVNGADVWAIEAMPSPEGVAAFVSPSGKFDDIGPRMAPDEARSGAVARGRGSSWLGGARSRRERGRVAHAPSSIARRLVVSLRALAEHNRAAILVCHHDRLASRGFSDPARLLGILMH